MTLNKAHYARCSHFAMVAAMLTAGCYSGHGDDPPAAEGDGDGAGTADDDGGTAGTPLDACGDGIPVVQPRALHRLTPLQYRNTVADLFGDPGFTPSYEDQETIPTVLGVRQLRTDAEQILARRDQWGVDVFGCDVTGAPDAACAERFIDEFGGRAFRRPLSDDERQQLIGLYSTAAADSAFGFSDAMEIVLAAMLQAPQFLYLPEVGEAIDGAPEGIRRLTGYETASRLSYLLWDTTPDAELLSAAAAGDLATRDGLRAQADRMLADPRTEGMVQAFMWEWLQLDGGQLHHALEESSKDTTIFPEYTAALQDSMRTEFEAFIRDVYFTDAGSSFERLMTDNRAYVDASMAALYGVPAPAGGWDWVTLDPTERGGLLTRAAFLTVFSSSNAQSPIRRGVYVVEEMLCNELGSPPPNVDNSPIDGGETDDGTGNVSVLSVRQEVEARTKDAQCQGCHGIVNPVGFAFEHYDAIGRWQDVELGTGLPLDSNGELKASDVDGPVADALELSEKLAGSQKVRGCFAGRWLYRATGTTAMQASDCDREETLTRFSETGDMRELLVSVILSDSFRFVNTADQ